MRRIFAVALAGLLMVTATLLAQDQPAPWGRVTGTVICGDTRRPARGAVVMVTPLPSLETRDRPLRSAMARVATDGTYVADRLEPGEYTVIALLPGYLSDLDDLLPTQSEEPSSEKRRAMMEKNGTVLVQGAETSTYNVELTRGAAVSGRVLYADGAPAPQVNISVEDTNANRPTNDQIRAMITHQNNTTDDLGRFRIAGLPPGSYWVAAAQIGGGDIDAGGGFNMAMTLVADPGAFRLYSGDTTSKRAARVYELHPGDEVSDIIITIPIALLHQVRGTLSATGGKTINHATVTLKESAASLLSFSSHLDQDGKFVFPQVPAGTYTLAIIEARMESPRQADGDPQEQPPATLFADESRTVIVKDADITDANFTLKEAPQADPAKTPAATTVPPP